MDAPTRRGRRAEEEVDGSAITAPPAGGSRDGRARPPRRRRTAPAALAAAVVGLGGVLAASTAVAPAAAAPAGVPALDAAPAGAEAASDASRAAEERENGRSFASAFFVSRKMGAGGTEPRVELLGSAVIWLLLLLSVGSLGLIGHLAAANRRAVIMPPTSFTALRDLLRGGRYREAIEAADRDGSFFAQVLAAALREGSHGWDAMVHALDQRTDELVADRQRRVEILNVLGQVSPMIGLFGTVYGMILAFQSIVSAGGAADPVMLAGGIGTALTTTFWGLVVAIPALTGYAVVRALMDARTAEAALAAEELVGLFRPSPESRRRSGGAARSPGSGAERRSRGPRSSRGGGGEAGDADGEDRASGGGDERTGRRRGRRAED